MRLAYLITGSAYTNPAVARLRPWHLGNYVRQDTETTGTSVEQISEEVLIHCPALCCLPKRHILLVHNYPNSLEGARAKESTTNT